MTCPKWDLEPDAPIYPVTGPLRWECSKCGTKCERPDNGKGRQEVACACGQGIILLNTDREGWLD